MSKINFIKENISIDIEKNTVLLDAIRQVKKNIEAPCNGMGVCGKCKVIAKGQLSEITESEKKLINENKYERLSCMAVVLGDVDVELNEKLKIFKTINKGFSIDIVVDSPVKIIRLPKINKSSSVPYVDYLGYKANSVNLYKKIACLEESYEGDFQGIWGVVFEEELLDIISYEKDILGVAIDIGTTGVSYYLVNLKDGEVLGRLSSLNPQTQYGSDVLTRITYCMENPLGAMNLQKLIVDEINLAIKKITDNLYNVEDIYHIIISANTTMQHLLLGINPESLAKSPYRSVFLSTDNFKAKDILIELNKEAVLSIIPSASSYVGGDIVSGIMASGFQNKNEAVFIDIGTNGELAALKDGNIISASTAAGPALEGMNIECGCRAETGAMEAFQIDEDLNIQYSTIGDAKPIGICGSGLIDIVGALVKSGLLDKTGRWSKNIDSKLADRLKDKKFYITENIYISQKDIRQIQLAKGAISAGLMLMLEEAGLKIDEISTIYIAGAFGYHINPDNIKIVGLIPNGFRGDIKFLGNTSLEGARLALINRKYFHEGNNIKGNMKVLELSSRENFQDIFVSQLNF